MIWIAWSKRFMQAEPDLGRVNHASGMGAAIAIADYYIKNRR
jgi:hypothetical protein